MELKSEQRIRYESEINLVQKRFGSLEDMRNTLGFSQRKMAELLMVDPSAWTRWTKDGGEKAPPYVYRALAWYLELLELRRGAEAARSAVAPMREVVSTRDIEGAALSKINFENVKGEIRDEWQEQFHALRDRYEAQLSEGLSKTERVTLGWKLFLLLNTVAVIYMIFFR